MASLALQRTKQWLEDKGWHVEITEKWNSWAFIRQDAFGLHDLMAVRADSVGVWGINACEDNGAVSAHVKKYLDGGTIESGKRKGQTFPPNPHLATWLSGQNRFSIFGWGKRGEAGKRKKWTLRVLEAYLEGAEVKFREVTPEPVDVPE